MPKSQIDSAALVAATLAGALALMLLPGPFAWVGSIGGLILFLIILAYDQEGYRSLFQSFAYSAVCGFCFMVASGAILQLLGTHGEVHLANGQWPGWLPLVCGFVTAIIWAIDRARMSGRGLRENEQRSSKQRSFIPAFAPSPMTAAPNFAAPPPVSTGSGYGGTVMPESPEPDIAPLPPLETATMYGRTVVPEAVAPAIANPQSGHTESFRTEPIPEPARIEPAAPDASRPSVTPIIPRTGKEAIIYVNLTGEGLNLLRSVQAEHLGRDYYRIIEAMPEGETWEYQPGQVVRCKKKNLSTGKALVAFEEAPRAQ